MLATDVFATCENAIPLILVSHSDLSAYLDSADAKTKAILTNLQFNAKSHTYAIITDSIGGIEKVIVGYQRPNLWAIAALPMSLPEANYLIDNNNSDFEHVALELGWALGAYQFTRYKKTQRKPAKLVIRQSQDAKLICDTADAIFLVRDLINTPAEDMNPAALAEQARVLAETFSAQLNIIVGEQLLKQNFPTIHRVGRAATDVASQPRLIEIIWGNPNHNKLVLVGKGVCFDTGGLDLKPSKGMLLMKKDMGGAAHCLALAQLIMAQNLPIHIRVLIPVVENAIAANAMRPGDIIKTRKGLTVEVGNTDAEGRLILADALTYACEHKHDLILDFATLTGAHHVALGPCIPAILSGNNKISAGIQAVSETCSDLMWPLPLYSEYRSYIDSAIADINNSSRVPYAGCITAGLFLAEFVLDIQKWVHFDLMAYNSEALPGRPIGGDAQGLRAIFAFLNKHFI